MISVILPGYEQPRAVLCAIAALENQTLEIDATMLPLNLPFELVIVDDSEGDSVKEAVERHGPSRVLYTYLRSSPPRMGSFTTSRARNIGAANARGDLLVFIDQDVMLAPDALENYARAYARHGDNTVILGLYHWLPRMEFGPDDVRERFHALAAEGLTPGADPPPFKRLPMEQPGLQGIDMRMADFGDIDLVVDDAALGCLSGNIGYPRHLFLALGGFDENIKGHGGEDADLGLTAKTHGAKFCLFQNIWGLHRWHGRNQAQNAREVQANIAYIDRKHGIGQYAGARKWMDAQNWSDHRHYQKEVGGVLMQADGETTVWVCRDNHRIGLPIPQWIASLGFGPEEILVVPASALLAYEVMGIAGQ